LTSAFNFRTPNGHFGDDRDPRVKLPSTDGYLPPIGELSGAVNPPDVNITPNNVIVGVPAQEHGIRPARALPYELDAYAKVDASNRVVNLTFVNTGKAGAVFHVRSGAATDQVRMYTVEAGKSLSGSWTVAGGYDLKVYGPNGFARFFKGSVAGAAAALDLRSEYRGDEDSVIKLIVRNGSAHKATVTVVDAYSGERITRSLGGGFGHAEGVIPLERFRGWYDLLVTVAEDPGFQYRLAGHVETGRDSISDPAMGGLVNLRA
jgi:phospholipase C